MSVGVAMVSCVFVCQKRAKALAGARLVARADMDRQGAEALARKHAGASVTDAWWASVDRFDLEVVVAATNDMSAEIPRNISAQYCPHHARYRLTILKTAGILASGDLNRRSLRHSTSLNRRTVLLGSIQGSATNR